MPRAYMKYVKSYHNVMKSISRKEDLQCLSRPLTQNAKKGEKVVSKLYIFSNLKQGLEVQDFSTVKYRGRNSMFFHRTVKVGIPQVKAIIKLTKMTN